MEVLPGIFYKTSYGCMCQSYCFLFWLFCCFFACWPKNTIKIGFFDDFEMLIFSFFGQKSWADNLAMVELITWPFVWPKFCPEKWPSYQLYFFHLFFCLLVFFAKNLIHPAERRRFLKNKKKQQKNKQKNGQVISSTWPSYQHYSTYIYIYAYASPNGTIERNK